MKTNQILLISGVAILGGMLLYFSKNKEGFATATPVQPGQPDPDTQVKVSTKTSTVINSGTYQNTGVYVPLAVQASKPVVAVSAGLRPAESYVPFGSDRVALQGAWRSNQ